MPDRESGFDVNRELLETVDLTQMNAHFEFMATNGACRLEPLLNLLNAAFVLDVFQRAYDHHRYHLLRRLCGPRFCP